MKKGVFILLAMFLLCTNYSQAQWSSWGDWKTTNCFRGIDFRVRTQKTSSGKYEVEVEYRNRYYEAVHFRFDVKGGNYSSDGRVSIKPNSTYKSYAGISFTSDYVYVYIDKLRFGRDDLSPYANCDK